MVARDTCVHENLAALVEQGVDRRGPRRKPQAQPCALVVAYRLSAFRVFYILKKAETKKRLNNTFQNTQDL